MEKVKNLYNNEMLGVAALAVEIYFSHLQLMSYMEYGVEPGESWDSDTSDYFAESKKLAMRFSQDNFTGMYILSTILVCVIFLAYLILGSWLHRKNSQPDSVMTPVIWVVDHIIFGLGWVPILAQYADSQICNPTLQLDVNNDYDCYKDTQLFLVFGGFFFASLALMIAVVPLASFKSERKGIEERYGHEYYFPSLVKLLDVAVIFALGTIRMSWIGLVVTLLLAVYLGVYICYKNPWVAALRMSVLVGQAWVFLCAEAATNDGDTGSSMLYAWPVFLILGGAIMLLRIKFVGSLPVHPIEK